SKSWDEFASAASSPIDIAITVCGNAAGEACPIFTGAPVRTHWGLPDPADVEGSEEEVDAAFARTAKLLEMRISAFLALPLDTLSPTELRNALNIIGQMEGVA
ncbi:MAG: arsenate reductase ArsC, partial [Sphingorhabdus sp.]